MKKSQFTFRILALFVTTIALAAMAHAQNTRTWVAGNGNDANPCTNAAPCLTFAAALALTNAGGEINVKNAGRFADVTITKSITIDGGGSFSGIIQGGGNSAITVDDSTSATPNTAVVTLRNLSLNGVGATLGSNGVNFVSGKALNIENCHIQNFSNAGVNTSLTVSGSNVNIKNTNIFNTGTGVIATSTSGFVTVSLNGCNVEQNTTAGVTLSTGGYASIRDSVIHFNGVGVQITGSGNSVTIKNSQINHNNGIALSVGASTTLNLGSSTIMYNVTNFSNSGTIRTFGNNQTETNPLPGVVVNLGLR